MKTVLRIAGKESVWLDIPNPYNMIPNKGDYIVFQQTSYTVSYLEFDYDSNTVYIVIIK